METALAVARAMIAQIEARLEDQAQAQAALTQALEDRTRAAEADRDRLRALAERIAQPVPAAAPPHRSWPLAALNTPLAPLEPDRLAIRPPSGRDPGEDLAALIADGMALAEMGQINRRGSRRGSGVMTRRERSEGSLRSCAF